VDVFANAGPIVGREAELGALEAALSGLEEGEAGFLSFEGEPGIGKTRLLRELRERAASDGHLVLAGAGAEFERDLPYGVWVDALDDYVASQDLALSDDAAHELARVLPSLRADSGDGAVVAEERYRVHRAMRSLLSELSDDQALLLVLDDLQWADDASLELLGALLGRDLTASTLIAIGFRSGQAPESLAAALAARSDARHVLAPLDEAQAAELLTGVERDAAAAIISRGGGVPFYLEQLARAGSAASAAAGGSDGLALGGVPDAVVATLAQELNALAPAARALLDAAAVTGEPFELDLAAAVAGASPGDALDALDDLLAADLVRATAVPRRFEFRHPIVRQAVYESLRAGRRLAAHARAAEELAARGASASERAAHVEFAAAQGDEAAIAVLLEAGDETLGRAPTSSARWYEAALRLMPGGDRDRQVQVLLQLASALRASGDLERCRTTLLDGLARLPPQADARRIELTTMCAAVEHWQGRHADAHRRLTGAYEDLTDRDTPQAAVLQIELAVDSLYEMDHPHAVAMAQDALATAQRLEDRGLVMAAAAALALAAAVQGSTPLAQEHRALAVAELERLPEPELAGRLDALYHLGWAENYLERYDDAIAHADRGLDLARASGQGRLMVPLLLVKGYPFEMQGRLTEALEAAQTAIEIARLSANPHYLFWAWFELAWARYYAGDLAAAIEACDESQRVGDGKLTLGTMPSAGGGPGWARAAAQLESGDAEGALAMVEQLGDDDLHWAIPVERCFNWESIALAEIAVGKLDEAERHAAKAEETAAGLGLQVPLAAAGRTRSAVALATGDLQTARGAGETAVAAADAVGATLQAAFARLALGRALVAADERKAAIAMLREAEQDFAGSGSHRARDEARRELRKLGARAEPRGPAAAEGSGVGALTKREREIANLVTDRMTNREIAAELFLSDKTVESHIRNIFIKLGVSSRVEVARAIERETAHL
jgi:DNA-binding CsgD family transcriptional regulator/tetratricopeptide (TPR) repeat protein